MQRRTYREPEELPAASPTKLRAHATGRDVWVPVPQRAQRPAPQTVEEEPTSVGVIPKSATRYRALSTTLMYAIPMSDGTIMRVNEKQLSQLPPVYQQYAQQEAAPLNTSGDGEEDVAVPRPRRQPHPKLPTQDETVIAMGPARARETEEVPPSARTRRLPRFHWLFWLGMLMCLMLGSAVLLTTLANWWQITQDDWHYRRPRTYQVDAVVGHHDSPQHPSHFLVLNLNRQVEVIEFPGGDATHAKIYIGPLLIGPGQDLAPVTLSFRDVNGDGKVDMIINVQGSQFLFLNDGTQFGPAPHQ